MLRDTRDLVVANHIGPGYSLGAKLSNALDALNAGDVAGTCRTLQAFNSEVRAQADQHLTAAETVQLSTVAAQLRNQLGCWLGTERRIVMSRGVRKRAPRERGDRDTARQRPPRDYARLKRCGFNSRRLHWIPKQGGGAETGTLQ